VKYSKIFTIIFGPQLDFPGYMRDRIYRDPAKRYLMPRLIIIIIIMERA
jgi:hypothetical protein